MNMREDLKAFVDNEISEADRVRILKELENNPELQAEVIELRQMSRMVREEAWQPEPVGLDRTLRALDGVKRKRPWWLNGPLQVAAGAACVALVVVIFFPVFSQAKESAKSDSFEFATSAAPAPASTPAETADGDMQGRDAAKGQSQPRVDAGWSSGGAGADLKAKQEAAGEGGAPNVSLDYPSNDLGGSPVTPGRGRGAFQVPSGGKANDAGLNFKYQDKFANARLEVKTANLAIEVESVPKAQLSTEEIAKAVKGRVQSSSKQDDEGRLASAQITLRVPVASFQSAVNRVRKLGRVTGDKLDSDDVTAEVADTEARLKVLRAEEKQYTELIKSAKKVSEVLEVKDKLSETRQEIESMDATRKALRGQASESTINVELRAKRTPEQPRQNTNWSNDTFVDAVGSLNTFGRKIGGGLVYVYVFAPIWLPVALLSWWGLRRRTI